MTTIKTYIHAYSFDLSDSEQAAKYAELHAKLSADLKAVGSHCMRAIGNYWQQAKPINGQEIELETKHLFDNQWNTAPISGVSDKGLRVFDWAEDALFDNRSIKRGHYLDITPEMAAIRRDTLKCGYCGKQEPASSGLVFCPHCLDSKYLDEETLLKGATRLKAVSNSRDGWQPLTAAESRELLPKFLDAQIHGNSERGKARIKARVEKIKHECELAINNATAERDGFLWLLEHGVNTDNVIFYKHTGKFSFGWRKPLSANEKSRLLDALGAEFSARFDYEIKEA